MYFLYAFSSSVNRLFSKTLFLKPEFVLPIRQPLLIYYGSDIHPDRIYAYRLYTFNVYRFRVSIRRLTTLF